MLTHHVGQVEDGGYDPEVEWYPLVPQMPGPGQGLDLVGGRADNLAWGRGCQCSQVSSKQELRVRTKSKNCRAEDI